MVLSKNVGCKKVILGFSCVFGIYFFIILIYRKHQSIIVLNKYNTPKTKSSLCNSRIKINASYCNAFKVKLSI